MENQIELLNKNTSQLADWQFREVVVDKINQIISKLNQPTDNDEEDEEEDEEELTGGENKSIQDNEFSDGDIEDDKEDAESEVKTLGDVVAEEDEAKARAEEERAAKELENQNVAGSQQ